MIDRAPEIETARLILRGHAVSDFPAVHALWCDPSVTRYITGRAATREESWSRLLRYRGHWALLGFGYWAVINKSTGQFLGETGFADFHRDMPGLEDCAELGWVIGSAHQRQGFAREALEAALLWARDGLSGLPLRCIIDPANAPSLQLALRLGFAQPEQVLYKGEPVLLHQWRGQPR